RPLTHSLDYSKEQAMGKHTCTVDGCGATETKLRMGMCQKHYRRAKKQGMVRKCADCQTPLQPGTPSRRTRCDDCNICKVPGCEYPTRSSGWCVGHYQRSQANNGDPNRYCAGCKTPIPLGSKLTFCSEGCRPKCCIEGCDSPKRVKGWCQLHYDRWHLLGNPLAVPGKVVAPRRDDCVVCGGEIVKGWGRRELCSGRCQTLYWMHGGKVPTTTECVACGDVIDLTVRIEGKNRKRYTTSLCDECRSDHGRIWQSQVPDIIKRDGLDCGICGNEIDQTIAWPDPHSLSVDHIMPRSLGGSHDLETLRLAHLSCNVKRSNRIDELQAA